MFAFVREAGLRTLVLCSEDTQVKTQRPELFIVGPGFERTTAGLAGCPGGLGPAGPHLKVPTSGLCTRAFLVT